MAAADATDAAPRSAWARNLAGPVNRFVHAQVGSAAILLAGTIAALLWVNVHPASYADVWDAHLELRLGSHSLDESLRHWVNDGLMTFFFLIVGLEARRELDMGELRERSRISLPVLAGIGGMVLPVLIYLAINAGSGAARGWGAAMSTDTAFALGVLAVVGARAPTRLRVFLLTVAVVDDLIALLVIATVYAKDVDAMALALGLVLLVVIAVLRHLALPTALPCLIAATLAWVAFLESGVDPVIVGLAIGLSTAAYPAKRSGLEAATERFRSFREQPTPDLARSARSTLNFAISPNERLQSALHPWTSYLIVPLFALANAGIAIDGAFLRRAATSPVTLGILIGYVVGKPLGIVGASWLAVRLQRGHLRVPVAWPALAGGGAVAGIGFTVSLLISGLAFTGPRLDEAKAGVLASAVASSVVAWLVFRLGRMLPAELRIRQLARTATEIVDLATAVDPRRDHVRGPATALVTLVEYGDFECPFCGQAEGVIRELLAEFGDDVRYVWRHLPLADVHPRAQLASEAAEAASAQGAFWPMYDVLLGHQDALRPADLVAHAAALGLDTDRFSDELRKHVHAPRIAEDVDDADLSGVAGTPTFFINGLRHHGAYDVATLTAEVGAARKRALADRKAGVDVVPA